MNMETFKAASAAFFMSISISSVQATEQAEPTAPVNFNELARQCASGVHYNTMQAIARTESGFNPFAIGVVGGAIKQPTTFSEAVEAARQLDRAGRNFSMGLSQINRYNLAKYNLDYESVFDPCLNLKVGAEILSECFSRAPGDGQNALQKALSCYYSGNFKTGFTQDLAGLPTYVQRVIAAASKNDENQLIKQTEVKPKAQPKQVIPEIDPNTPAPVQVKVVAKPSKPKPKPKKRIDVVMTDVNKTKEKASWDAFGDW